MCEFKKAIHKYRNGATLYLFVTPRSDRVVFPAGYDQWRKRVEIKVSSEAKENKANKEVIKEVAEYFNKSTRDISIISGEKSREKALFIKNVSIEFIVKKLKESLDFPSSRQSLR